jgi:hypothetical protein
VALTELTEVKAQVFDALREVYGPDGSLTLLNLTGKTSEGVNTYAAVSEIPAGWYAEAKRGPDGRAYTNLQIADVYQELRDRIDGTPPTTHYAFGGTVRSVERDTIFRPVSEPLVWELRGYETEDVYE